MTVAPAHIRTAARDPLYKMPDTRGIAPRDTRPSLLSKSLEASLSTDAISGRLHAEPEPPAPLLEYLRENLRLRQVAKRGRPAGLSTVSSYANRTLALDVAASSTARPVVTEAELHLHRQRAAGEPELSQDRRRLHLTAFRIAHFAEGVPRARPEGEAAAPRSMRRSQTMPSISERSDGVEDQSETRRAHSAPAAFSRISSFALSSRSSTYSLASLISRESINAAKRDRSA